MTQKNTYTIACPECSAEQEIELYDSLTVSDDDSLKQALFNNEINQVDCEACEYNFRVDKPLLYHDIGRKFMIYWFPGAQALDEEQVGMLSRQVEELTRMMPDDIETPEIMVVYLRVELVEKIFLLEAGMDDRVIEYIKSSIYTNNLERLDPNTKLILFNAQDSTEEDLCFVVQDLPSQKLEGMLQYKREAYEALSEMFDDDDQTANLFEMFPGPYISARQYYLENQSDQQPDQPDY